MRHSLTIAISLFVGITMSLLATPETLAAPSMMQPNLLPLSSQPGRFKPGEFVVKFKPSAPAEQIAALNQHHAAKVVAKSRFAGFQRLSVPPGLTVARMVEIYRHHPLVEYAEPNFVATATFEPDDPYYQNGYQWHLRNPDYPGIQMKTAWDNSTGDGVLVAILDTGIAYENYGPFMQAPDLAQTQFVSGYDCVDDDAHPNDEHGHGTHVAGTVAQSTNNSVGVAGVAFHSTIMPVRVLNAEGSGSHTDIADCIHFATDNGAKVINMSLGGSPSNTLQQAVAYAHDQGVTVVASAGNGGPTGATSYPAAYDDDVIAVAASRYDETVSYYSTWGDYVDITAPGGDLTVDQNGDGYGDGVLQQTFNLNTKDPADFAYWFLQGTSMASPHVAGVAALLLAQTPSLTPDEVRSRLLATARDIGQPGWDPASGWGLVQASDALSYQNGDNIPPSAYYSYSCSGQSCDFDGSASSDSDGTIASYSWEFGDGGSGSGASVSHTFSAGSYAVTLTVTDDDGADTGITQTVAVTALPASTPSLSVSCSKIKGSIEAYLNWENVPDGTNGKVDIYRNFTPTSQYVDYPSQDNDGEFIDNDATRLRGERSYMVCQAGADPYALPQACTDNVLVTCK